jgi:predicted CopG family antitoxin
METYSKLRDLGYTGESFNTVIKRLIRSAKTHELQKNFENGEEL